MSLSALWLASCFSYHLILGFHKPFFTENLLHFFHSAASRRKRVCTKPRGAAEKKLLFIKLLYIIFLLHKSIFKMIFQVYCTLNFYKIFEQNCFYCFSKKSKHYGIQGYRGKNPRGWGFFPPVLTEPSRKKKNPPMGLFPDFLRYPERGGFTISFFWAKKSKTH